MTITGTVRIPCPHCKQEQESKLVQSINARQNPELKARLLAGDLNMFDCASCGKRTLLLATLLYHDPDREYFCQACPGGEPAMTAGAAAFLAIGAVGTRRLVPSQNALVEKVKLLEAGLDDRVIEVLKVILLAADNEDLNSILLFDQVDRDAGLLRWILLKPDRAVTSPLAAYDKLALTLKPTDDLRIDRAWALEAARAMMTNAN
ncbi:MAG: CpXC domain-containing protein [Myxococcota bacterium]|nr:CpXC domain-containing protein [Deltaproteobacteria bacterium]MDQ3339611.1 CpXC domain-containing protein [Myxococcota bacterium]